MPTQNAGIAPPSCDSAEKVAPYQVRDFQAAKNPTGTAITTARAKEMSVSGRVTFRRRAISSPTSRRLVKDCPRSSVASWAR
mgnify:CR=1 FL=1